MRRLRFTGRDLQHLVTEDNLHVRLHLPTDNDSEFHTRYYTIRRVDAEAGWLDIDFVVHNDGPGANFARHAVSGMVCNLSGPCGLGIKPAEHYLLAGDETALPAIARIAEMLPKEAAVKYCWRSKMRQKCWLWRHRQASVWRGSTDIPRRYPTPFLRRFETKSSC